MADWQPIETVEQREGLCVLVDNGERVGEAMLYESYEYDDETDECGPRLAWRWTHHGSCSCCWGDMMPQPKWWQFLPDARA